MQNNNQRNIERQENHKAQETPINNIHASRGNASSIQRDLDNNPNFFYNEELFLQQAMQESLLQPNGNNIPGRATNEDELFNQMLKETLVLSQKEYDDIDRKKKEEELMKLKDNPAELQRRLADLLNRQNAPNAGKKLPPLAAINKPVNNKKNKKTKDLATVKAPILQNTIDSHGDITDRRVTHKHLNDTESEIDIKESSSWKDNNKTPSYNPKLLNQQDKHTHDNLFSLQSNEFGENEPRFIQANNENTDDNLDLNNLIADLDDEEPAKVNRYNKIYSGSNEGTQIPAYSNKVDIFPSHDSFEDLMDEFDDAPKPKNGLPGMAKVHIIKKQDNYDDFDL